MSGHGLGHGEAAGEPASGAGPGAGRGRVSPEQVELLLAFMEEHSEFALGKQSVYSRFSASKLWRLLAERLNGAGGARKSPDKWCRYWADMKYKARRKSAAGGALGELSAAEERLRAILGPGGAGGAGGSAGRAGPQRAGSVGSEGSAGSATGGADELLAEAALRQALAAEKQAEAVTQGVELLRELVALLAQRLPHGPGPAVGHSLLHHHQM